jgi:glycosyltransferase involved in cell wall biosynthesis
MRKKIKNPLISVVIPTYNRGQMVKEAVCSVLAQDFRNFELILVDDGSTDNTPDILDEFRDELIVIRQENKGVSAARNRGIAAASGELIAFLDSDDLWLPKKLSEQAGFFQSNPDALICQTEEIWIRNGVRVNPKKKHQKRSGMIFDPSLSLCLVSPSAVMMRRELFEIVGGFDETLPACEDYDLWLRVGYRYPIFLTETPLIIKRGGHEDQLSSAAGLDKFRIRSIKNLIEKHVLSEDQCKTAITVLKEKCRIYAGGCLKRGRAEEAAEYLRLSRSQKFAVPPSGGRSDQDNRLILKEPPKGGTANFINFRSS